MFSKMGEEYLVVLPETIPFLAELIEGKYSSLHEDHDEQIQEKTQEIIASIEAAMGENIKSYF